MEQWLKAMCDGRLNVESRRARIIRIRRYLIWLFDKEIIIADPDDLLRTSDLPKLPSRLPRPFSPEADRQIQERFAASSSIYCQALLLMRHTGIRIGELARLEYQCLENDHNGNAFLKVPLGKLDNERLVPLAPDTRRLLEKIQQQTFKKAPYLLTPQHARSTLEYYLKKALKKATEGLDIPGPVVSHRLRHTYATQLLNAGMSLVSIMKLLGHRSFRMTLIYAAITQETVVKDYHIALKKIEAQYATQSKNVNPQLPDPERLLLDMISWLRKNRSTTTTEKRRADAIIKRIHHLREDVRKFIC